MKNIVYILSVVFMLFSCIKKEDETININILTKGITDIVGNTAIGHGSILIDDNYAVLDF